MNLDPFLAIDSPALEHLAYGMVSASMICMANGKMKTEMKGTGGGRWTTREDAKRCSKKQRRANDKAAAKAGA